MCTSVVGGDMEEVKLIGTAEPSDSGYHVRRMEEVDNLEEEHENNEGRHVVKGHCIYFQDIIFFPK